MRDMAFTSDVTIVPANEASCGDLQAVFGTRGYAASCQCQRFKIRGRDWDLEWTKPGPAPTSFPVEERAHRLRTQTQCGHPESDTTSGLIAYLEGEPVGWCAIEPRTAYLRLRGKPLVWAGRAEDKSDESVWAVTCFITLRATGAWASAARSLVPPSTSPGNAAHVRSRDIR